MKALRTFIFMMLVTVSLQVAAQSMVEKWNDFYKRSEFYDSHGKLLGWKKYNEFYKRWEYFDSHGQMTKYDKHNDF